MARVKSKELKNEKIKKKVRNNSFFAEEKLKLIESMILLLMRAGLDILDGFENLLLQRCWVVA